MNYPKDKEEVIELLQTVVRLAAENFTLRDMVVALQQQVKEAQPKKSEKAKKPNPPPRI